MKIQEVYQMTKMRILNLFGKRKAKKILKNATNLQKNDRRVRYTKQRNNFSCGPIAIINVLKWAGYKISYQTHYKFLSTTCKTNDDWGTYRTNISKALRLYSQYVGFKFKRLVTFRDIEENLNNGCAVIFEYFYKEDDDYDGHYEVIVKEGKRYFAINSFIDGVSKTKISKDEIIAKLKCKMYRYYGSPSAWFVKKKEKKENE